jgi:hypothetical protein
MYGHVNHILYLGPLAKAAELQITLLAGIVLGKSGGSVPLFVAASCHEILWLPGLC